MVEIGHIMLGLQPEFCSKDEVEVEKSHEGDDISVYGSTTFTTTPAGKRCAYYQGSKVERKSIAALYNESECVVLFLRKSEQKGFVVKTRKLVQWKRLWLLVTYCCDILDNEDMPEVQQGIAVKRPCAKIMLTEKNIMSGLIASEKSLKDYTVTRRRYIAVPEKMTLKLLDDIQIVDESKLNSALG